MEIDMRPKFPPHFNDKSASVKFHHRRQVNVYDAEYAGHTCARILNNVGATHTKCPKPDFDVMSGRNLWYACLWRAGACIQAWWHALVHTTLCRCSHTCCYLKYNVRYEYLMHLNEGWHGHKGNRNHAMIAILCCNIERYTFKLVEFFMFTLLGCGIFKSEYFNFVQLKKNSVTEFT